MKRRRQRAQIRNRILVIAGWLSVTFLLFGKQLAYLIRTFWYFIQYNPVTLDQLAEAGLVDKTVLGQSFFQFGTAFVLFWIVLIVANLFNSQFLLPVYLLEERWKVFETFSNFMFNNHGPLVFVKDGEIISHLGEKDRTGPGVALVNSNSAVVVGHKVHGPGLVFTDPKKKVGKMMDLRKQVRTSRDVRAVTRDGIEVSTDITIQFSISAPPEVIYVCLDGAGTNKEDVRVLELDERMEAVIQIIRRDFFPDELNEIFRTLHWLKTGQTQNVTFVNLNQYAAGLFVQDRVQGCHTNEPSNPKTGEKISWHELPIDIAEEEFRNTIVRYPFDDLFLPSEEASQEGETTLAETEEGELTANTRVAAVDYLKLRRTYPLEAIRDEFSERVHNSGFLAYIFVQKRGGKPIKAGDRLSDSDIMVSEPVLLEYPRPLRRSMITVAAVGFGEIAPTNEEVRRQTVQNLIARWNSEAFRTEVGFDEQAAMIRSRAKAQVQQDTVYALRDVLRNSGRSKTALILRIFQALEAATVDSGSKEMVEMVKMLGDLREWFKVSGNEIEGSAGSAKNNPKPSGRAIPDMPDTLMDLLDDEEGQS